jgi:hypothetical protein
MAKMDAYEAKMLATISSCVGKAEGSGECKELNPDEMKSESEHREISKEDAVVKPVKGRKKRHRGQKLAAGRRGEPKELTRGDCGSQRKLAAACRKMSRSAAVAWHRRNFFRKIMIQ